MVHNTLCQYQKSITKYIRTNILCNLTKKVFSPLKQFTDLSPIFYTNHTKINR